MNSVSTSVLTLACISCIGCSHPRPSDRSFLTVVPGVGISDVLEIGMTIKDVKASAGQLVIQEHDRGADGIIWEVSVPAIAAATMISTKEGPFSGMSFFTDLSVFAEGDDRRSWPRFRGSISLGLSFRGEKSGLLKDVLHVFGRPENVIVYEDMSPFATQVLPLIRNGKSVWVQFRNRDHLYYPEMGISFALEDGVVYMFEVTKPIPAKGSPED